MKAKSKEVKENGHIILTCEKSTVFGLIKKEVQYLATEEYPSGYWNWRKLPNKVLVGDDMSFQLDSWCLDF